ncbi:MAG: hypothetical protein HZA84_03620 [Thaumarchaeota archaeon]|nr:hypothetical protein [Nitrososphaerota archaeon]
MQKILAPILLATFCGFALVTVHEAFGHGFGSETMPPVLIGGKNVTLSMGEYQLTPDSAQNSKVITIMLYETNTKKPISDVTFHVIASRHDVVLFDHTFQRHDGDLDINIITTDSKEVTIKEESGTGWLGSLVGSKSNAAIITGSIFETGGLYDFKVEILTAGSYFDKLDPPITYDVGLSIPDTKSYKTKDSVGTDQTIGIITYYDQISDFEFASNDKSVKFKMPFDWSEKNINQVSVVHQEIRIPKSFGDLLSSKYVVHVNGFKLPENAVIIDDYSAPDRLVHIIANRNDVAELGKNVITDNYMEFVLQPSGQKTALLTYTTNAQYSITLEHFPEPLLAGSDAEFLFEIREMPQNKTVAVPYDFVMIQNDKEIFKKTGTTDKSVQNKIQFQMPNNISGATTLRFENIGNNQYASADFPLAIQAPNMSTPLFPISLFSFSSQSGAKVNGNYQVDVTWFPSNLQIDEESEFVFTIRDVSTGNPVPNTDYEFVIIQNEKEIFRKQGFTSSGGDYVNYQFANGQQGTHLIRIENIGKSDQLVEIPVTVTPEFPLGQMLVFLASFTVIFAIRSRIFSGQK